MSAREELIENLQWIRSSRSPQARADEILRMHAHELAEELRGFGMEDAGNFIDPEVE